MKVCAEYEDQVIAMVAHNKLLAEGVDPEDVEIRSPYPLSEMPLPPHRSAPMNMRLVVRCMWALAVCLGFSFVSYTQFIWSPVAHTGSHPLISVPITLIVTYECGMITAILTTTLMFFLETFRHRQLVPALAEDIPVAFGHVVVVVSGKSAERSLSLFEKTGARSVVTYGLAIMLGLSSLFSSGCARQNMREQDGLKSTEASSEYAPPHSVRMISPADLKNPPPAPFIGITYGEQGLYMQYKALEAKSRRLDREAGQAEKLAQAEQAAALRAERKDVDDKKTRLLAQVKALHGEPKLFALKNLMAPPPEMKEWKNPIPADKASLDRGEQLFFINCMACHGAKGLGDGKVGEVEYIPPAKIGDGATYSKLYDGYFYYYIYTGKNWMPNFGYKLSHEEMCDIINYLRKLQGRV